MQSRWAWGTEEPSAVEKNVAPREFPDNWVPRLALLLLICWALVNCFTLFLLTVPIPLGRSALSLIYYPKFLHHDPLYFVLGCSITAAVVGWVSERMPKQSRRVELWNRLLQVRLRAVQQGTVLILLLQLMLL